MSGRHPNTNITRLAVSERLEEDTDNLIWLNIQSTQKVGVYHYLIVVRFRYDEIFYDIII